MGPSNILELVERWRDLGLAFLTAFLKSKRFNSTYNADGLVQDAEHSVMAVVADAQAVCLHRLRLMHKPELHRLL